MTDGKSHAGPVRTATWNELAARVGSEIGVSDWMQLDQRRIDGFADITGDHYFIHFDREKAASLPFGGMIAHGMLTLSLLGMMSYQVWPHIEGCKYPLNYGFDRVRFVSPVPEGARVRGHLVLTRAEILANGGTQMVTT